MQSTNAVDHRGIPPFDAHAKAIKTFSSPFFAPDPKFEEQRNTILGESPVFIVQREYLKKDDSEYRAMAADLGISHEALFRFIHQPFDKIFAEVGTFPLRRSDVVDDFVRRHVERPEAKKIFEAHNDPDTRRDFPLAYVVGPIGSGKTFFTLQYLKDFRNDSGLPSVLVYWQPWIWYRELDFAGEGAPSKLVERFFERMAWRIDSQYKREWNPKDDKLNLHVCLVLDEADNHEQKGFFEKRSMVTEFVRELEATQFAKSLMVVVVGSIVDSSTDLDDAKDAYFFRMKDWSSDDVYRLRLKRMRPSDP